MIGSNFNRYIETKFTASIPPNTIKVSPEPPKTVLFFLVKDPRKKAINDSALRRFNRLKGVKKVDSVMTLTIPLQARISFLGFRYRSDILAIGVPLAMVSGDLSGPRNRKHWKNPDPYGKMPVLIPSTIFEAYNEGMAGANNLPRISREQLTGLEFIMRFGHSSIRSLKNFEEREAVVAGVTGSVNVIALVLPLEAVKRYNKMFNDSAENEYLYSFITVRDHASLLEVTNRIKRMGYIVEAEKSLSARILKLRDTVAAVINSLMYVILGLACMAIFFSTAIAANNRIDYYRILRVLGASKLFISLTIVIKYCVIGFAGMYAGVFIMRNVTGMVSSMITVPLFNGAFTLRDDSLKMIQLIGTIIPLLSTMPVIIRRYFKALNRD